MHDKLGDFLTFIYVAVPLLILVLGVWTWWDKRKQHDSGCEGKDNEDE